MSIEAKKKLYLAFMWHMHQPYYKDDISGEYKMPWVFLHAIKDYYELVRYIEKFSSIKATFNVVPSLLEQLREYESGFVNDSLLSLIKKHVSVLTVEEKKKLSTMLFYSNPKTMILPLKRYAELYDKKNSFKDSDDFALQISDDEMVDLQVLFLLSWCSNALREKSKIVTSMLSKGRGFGHPDKEDLLDELFGFVKTIIPYYGKMQKEGRIEVSTTPYYHPILPLLLDKNAAKEADRGAVTPKEFADFRSDAAMHVKDAVSYYEGLFGAAPSTFWPAEGSVSVEALRLLSSNGVKHVGADEDVLFKSIEGRLRSNLYKKYYVGDDYKIGVLFRDKGLSDLLGFTYSNKNPKEAAADFISRLSQIKDTLSFNPVVPIILDGENAWEYYDNNAKDFFEALYEEIERADWCETLTFSEVFQKDDVESGYIEHIKPGSWIYGTFSTWMGHEEKNRGWELLSIAKNSYEAKKSTLTEEADKKAKKELMIAEGSDWFWWYGDDHYTPQADEFDELFRKHLINIYKIIGETPPQKMFEPICKVKTGKQRSKPKNYVSPTIDGQISDFYEWLGGGYVDLDADFSVMDSGGFHFEKLFWGFDDENIYFAIKGKFDELIDKGYELSIALTGSADVSFKLEFTRQNKTLSCIQNGILHRVEWAVGDVFEISVPKGCLACGCDSLLQASFEIQKNSKTIERAPLYGSLGLEVNEKFLEDWYI